MNYNAYNEEVIYMFKTNWIAKQLKKDSKEVKKLESENEKAMKTLLSLSKKMRLETI